MLFLCLATCCAGLKFNFAKGASIGKCSSKCETFKGHQGQDQEQQSSPFSDHCTLCPNIFKFLLGKYQNLLYGRIPNLNKNIVIKFFVKAEYRRISIGSENEGQFLSGSGFNG